jgi:hypothetical protein
MFYLGIDQHKRQLTVNLRGVLVHRPLISRKAWMRTPQSDWDTKSKPPRLFG